MDSWSSVNNESSIFILFNYFPIGKSSIDIIDGRANYLKHSNYANL